MTFVQRLLSLGEIHSCYFPIQICVSQKLIMFYILHWCRYFDIKLGIGKEKALSITQAIQKYGNLSGFGK